MKDQQQISSFIHGLVEDLRVLVNEGDEEIEKLEEKIEDLEKKIKYLESK